MKVLIRIGWAAALVGCLVCAGDGFAAVVYVDFAAVGAGDGSSWDDAYTTIQDGIDNASDGDEVWVASANYGEAITMASGVGLYGGFDGTETQRSERDPDGNVTFINAAGQASTAVTMSSITNASIDGFTIIGGDGTDGGGFYIDTVDATNSVVDCIITGNSASGDGGGLFITGSSLTISDCRVLDNVASSEGGGMFIYNCSPTITDTLFSGNSATAAGGGLLSRFGGANPEFTNCTFSGNTSPSGGAVYVSNNSTAEFTNCVFSGNAASSWGGAAFINGSWPIFAHCTIANNDAGTSGGAIHMFFQGAPELTNCIVYNNSGIAFYETAADTDVVLDSCLVESNLDGDYYDFDTLLNLTGPASLNALAEVTGTVEGAPVFSAGAASGTWTAAPSYSASRNTTTLTNGLAKYAVNMFEGMVLNVDTTQRFEAYVTGNTAKTITVLGDVSGIANNGNEAYAIVNYHIDSTSAAIDVGTSIDAPATDFDGDARPYNSLYDAGADEWGADDTDGDGLLTGDELLTLNTDPNDADSDDDGLDDGEEVNIHGTDPNLEDSDEDGLTDGEEVNTYGSNPNEADTDGDGLNDGVEVSNHGSDPTIAEVWLDFSHSGAETGLPIAPYSTLDAALSNVQVGGGIRISGGYTLWTGTITQNVWLFGDGEVIWIGGAGHL